MKKESLYFRIVEKNIGELASMDMRELTAFLETVEEKMDNRQRQIASEILKEIRSRLGFLLDVGLDYLSLNRGARTLSGGESQRIRLATQIGSRLVNVLYILDEPSIGLHQRDNRRLIESLKKLRDSGNSVIVVEHDREMILSADHVIDMGPLAGRLGGNIVAEGSPESITKSDSLTGEYLSDRRKIPVPDSRREGSGKFITIEGATGHNLKNITARIPLGTLTCVTGVSGSGKSSLINQTLHPAIASVLHNSGKIPLPYDRLTGLENIDKVIEVDQSQSEKPQSEPVDLYSVFTDIRNCTNRPLRQGSEGFKASRFSFNVKGGRCEGCQGAGLKAIEMNFLPDVHVVCTECNGIGITAKPWR
ncbi:MAG: hypothetical protein R2744_02915 [Bacteroidales bacterium]